MICALLGTVGALREAAALLAVVRTGVSFLPPDTDESANLVQCGSRNCRCCDICHRCICIYNDGHGRRIIEIPYAVPASVVEMASNFLALLMLFDSTVWDSAANSTRELYEQSMKCCGWEQIEREGCPVEQPSIACKHVLVRPSCSMNRSLRRRLFQRTSSSFSARANKSGICRNSSNSAVFDCVACRGDCACCSHPTKFFARIRARER